MVSDKAMLASTSVKMTVSFHDTDAMGVVWHGNYFRYFEIARETLLKTFDYGYRQMQESGYIWPIVDIRAKFIASLYFEDEITVYAELNEFENRLRINYKIINAAGKKTTTGYSIQVAINQQTREMCFASPQILFDKLGIKP